MLKNKIIVRKTRNIIILLMVLIIMLGAYSNIRRSKAENVIEIVLEAIDKDEILEPQIMTIEAKEDENGKYIFDLPKTVNDFIIAKYYIDAENLNNETENSENGISEIDMNNADTSKTIELTNDEITSKSVQMTISYDKKEAAKLDKTETTILYNKELKSLSNEDGNGEGEVIVAGYMPADAKLEIKDIDLAKLTSVKLENENQTLQKAYEISVFQEIEVQKEETVQKETAQKETTQKEAVQKETTQKEAVQKETAQKETTQKETVQNETTQKETGKEEDLIAPQALQIENNKVGSVATQAITDEKETTEVEKETTGTETAEVETAETETTGAGTETAETETTKTETTGAETETAEPETERVEYNPSEYGETLTIKTKNTQENTVGTIYSLPEDLETTSNTNSGKTTQLTEDMTKQTEIENIEEQEYVSFTTEKTEEPIKYTLATEPVAVDETTGDANQTDSSSSEITANSSNQTVDGSNETTAVGSSNEEAGIMTVAETGTLTPYIPSGYSYVEGAVSTGYVVQDSKGNQYVWVSVPKTTTVYPTAGVSITDFSDANLTKIENDLKTYTSTYRNGTVYTDTYYSDASTGLTQTEYNALKKAMLKSIYIRGGFYIGRYETGIESSFRTAAGTASQTPVVKQNAYPYNWVTVTQAQTLAETFASGNYKTSVTFGIQKDLTMKFLETIGAATTSELMSDSHSWGNYVESAFTVPSGMKFSWTAGAAWYSDGTTKEANQGILLGTGALSTFKKGNIYDLAGNVREFTLEYTNDTSSPINHGGGGYNNYGRSWPASSRLSDVTTTAYANTGFRVALFEEINDTERPDYTSYEIKNVTSTGYDVYVYGVSDNVGIDTVKFPTWTANNAQDDLVWGVGTNQGSGTWKYRVNVSDHNNETGKYFTHIYIYDTSGNCTAFWTEGVIVQDPVPEITIGSEVIKDGLLVNLDADNNTGNGHSGSATIWKDLAFSEANYTVNGGTWNNEYLTLDGTDDWVKMNMLNFNRNVTLEATIELNAIQSGQVFIVSDVENGGIGLELVDGKPYMFVIVDGIGEVGAKSSEVLSTNTKYHITGTYNGTDVKLYVNGELKATKTQAGRIKEATSDTVFVIGANPKGSSVQGGYANIDVYDIRMYDKTLTQSEIQQNINATDERKTYKQTRNVTVTISDTNGLATGASVKYGWSKSNTTAPTSYKTASINSYSSGATSTTFTASGEKLEGKYFLWVVPNTLKNTLGNSRTSNEISIGRVYFYDIPVWEKVSSSVDTANKTATITFKGTDVNFKQSTLTKDNIKILIDGTEATNITKTLSSATSITNGVQYTLTLSGFEEGTFQSGKSYMEWSGNTQIKIDAGTLEDTYGRKNVQTTLEIGQVDFIKPIIKYTYSESDINKTNKTVKVVFTVTDKYFSSSTLTANDLTILVDGENPGDKITKTLTSTDITATVNGTSKTVGKTYTLTLSNLEQTSIASGKNYLDYSGIITVAIPAGKITDTSNNSNDAKTITIGINETGETDTSEPYIPTGYTHVSGTTLDTGYVIEDSTGNQFVWVEVPQTTTVYSTAGLNITQFTDAELTKIENDLQTYTSEYRKYGYTDTWSSEAATGMTETEYNTQKKKMLKSIYRYGGFYVGRYEAGSTTARTSSSDALTTPVVKQNMYPYTYVTNAQAQQLSESFSSTGYISSLMYGVQWDLTLKYLENNGTTQAELNEDSTNWGNYANNFYTITNTNSKYSIDYGVTWTDGAYGKKTEDAVVYLSTGSNNSFSKMKIYDLAGNAWEWTLEYSSTSRSPSVCRGGAWEYSGNSGGASYREEFLENNTNPGSRTASAQPYTKTQTLTQAITIPKA